MPEQIFKEKTDSISVSKTSTGKYSWDIKIYNNDLMVSDNQDKVLNSIEAINVKLRNRFSLEE